MSTPTFTILLPTKGRPELVIDALTSILGQTFADFEVIVSNNGADPLVKEALSSVLDDPRVRYFEQIQVLPMPEHWEAISRLSHGRFQIVVPDRSVLHRGALATIAAVHAKGTDETKIVSWTWDLYHSRAQMLETLSGVGRESVVLDSDKTALSSFSTDTGYPLALPRGLNSSVATSIVEEIRARNGSAFTSLTPDFTFAYSCLMSRPRFTHLPQALSISQGLEVSNGGNAYRNDASAYLATLGLQTAIRYSPINAPLVENVIAEDFFATCHKFDRLDLFERFDRSALYIKCFAEWEIKRDTGGLTPEVLEQLKEAIQSALDRESESVRKMVNVNRKKPKISHILRSRIRRHIGNKIEHLRPFLLRMRGARRFNSVLEAAGFKSA